jgi:CheY-like chemotaxis protein
LGVSGYLIKPVKQTDLLDAIAGVLSRTPSDLAEKVLITRHTLREDRKRLHVLLAEDNPINRKLAVRMLENLGHKVRVAENGKEALSSLEKERFDLILMDVQMPEMDGLQTTRAIREREKTTGGHIPIVAMTAHALKGDRERCLEAGMDGYVSKPFNAKDLSEAIQLQAESSV